jgi:hypothetical protein
MSFKKLLSRYHAAESVDGRSFQARARLLQSVWREERGYEAASYRGKVRGSRLRMPWAKETLANYLTETVREVVRAEVLDPAKAAGKLYGQPRIFNNLLSSQPLCFNLFGELQRDLELASTVFRALSDGRIDRVVAIEFEHSPGRGDARFTGDSSAFDVFVKFQSPEGGRGFAGIEVKYHENLKVAPATLTARHEAIARGMGCFEADVLERLKACPLEQIWRDHLLAGAMLQAGGFDDGFFVFLAPAANEYCVEAVADYRRCLRDETTFASWTLEGVVEALRGHSDAEWVELFYDRYLDFAKIDRIHDAAVSSADLTTP